MKAETSRRPRQLSDRLIALLAVALLTLSLSGCSEARGKMSDLGCEADMGFIDNQPDVGITLSVTVKNVGKAGFINISPELSTSEGEWSRSQKLHFDADETKKLTYFFHEPSINATGIQCRVGVSPKAD